MREQSPRSFIGVVNRLREYYGAPEPPPNDPWELIVREVASYLVDDERREATYRKLAAEIGTTPDAILDASPAAVRAAIADGGMLPDSRREKLLKSARIAVKFFGGDLRAVVALPIAEARRALRKFPGIGEPAAERILLFGRRQRVLGLESNGLRVVVRLGFSGQKKSYEATWRATTEALQVQIERGVSYARLIEAHQLLRQHGKELCTRSRPLCERCPLKDQCAYYQALLKRS